MGDGFSVIQTIVSGSVRELRSEMSDVFFFIIRTVFAGLMRECRSMSDIMWVTISVRTSSSAHLAATRGRAGAAQGAAEGDVWVTAFP